MRSILINRLALLFILFAFSFVSVNADDFRKGEKTIGIELGYNTFNEAPATGIAFSYRFSRRLRVAPNVQYIFRKNHTDAFIFNCDIHVPFPVKASPVEFYPIAGISYASWNNRTSGTRTNIIDDVSTRDSQFGLNLGGGVGIKCSGNLRLLIEGRYSFVRDYNTTMILAGIAYNF